MMVADLVSVGVARLAMVRSVVLVAVAMMCCACRVAVTVDVFAVVARGAVSVGGCCEGLCVSCGERRLEVQGAGSRGEDFGKEGPQSVE